MNAEQLQHLLHAAANITGEKENREFGYYAHGVAPETATLPDGWEERLVEFKVKTYGGAISKRT